eukprot:TRINITY_DN59274_c0_g2_i1.p1 TRINITY_DN59274_c0_g2~~TRINITY_DN59274_c0_g2_i1.p1  ORF type:complete len:931 (+),score=141.90 TRINITY_DN59274_c0_g2_i1:281-3073(+)
MAILQALPTVAWEVNATTHVHVMNTHILSALAQEFPGSNGRETPQWMSDETAALLKAKAATFKAIVLSKRMKQEVQPRLVELHKAQAAELRRRTRLERAKAIADTQQRITDAFDANDARRAFKEIRKLQPYRPRPSVLLKDRNGVRAVDAEDNARIMLEHWKNKFDGDIKNPDELVETSRGLQVQDDRVLADVLLHVPTRDEIAAAILRTKPTKTHGDDLLASHVLRCNPAAVATHIHQIACKAFISGEPPVQWQGGCMATIPKSKQGPLNDPAKARGITLGSHAAKALNKAFRPKLAQDVERRVPDVVCGGIAGRGVDVALHARQQFCEYASRLKTNAAVIFLDLTSAFDRLVRDDLEQAFDCETYNYMVRVMHQSTWMSVAHSDDVVRYERGVRQGDPISDVTFIATIDKAVARIRKAMREAGLSLQMMADPHAEDLQRPEYDNVVLGGEQSSIHEVCDISFVDDVQIYLTAQSAHELCNKIKWVTALADKEFTASGHSVNYAKGKTECILQLRGGGQREVREDMAVEDNCLLIEAGGRMQRLRVVKAYKNLGNVQSFSSRTMQLASKAAEGLRAAYGTISASTLKSKSLPLKEKIRLLEIMLTKGLFGCESWPQLEPRHVAIIAAPYYKMMRQVVGEDWHHGAEMATNEEVLGYGLASMMTQLRIRRLRYLARYVAKAPLVLRILVTANADLYDKKGGEKCWIDIALDDLEWAWHNSDRLQDMPAPRANTKAWTDLIRRYPAEWKGILTKIYEAAKKGEIHDPDPTMEKKNGDAFQCEVCGKLCINAQALSLHMLGTHKIRAAARGFVDATNTCWVCGIKCPSRGRCMMHYRQGIIRSGSGSCFGQLLLRGAQPLDEEQIISLEDQERRRRGTMRRQGRHGSDVDSWSAVLKSPMKWPERQGPLPRWAYRRRDGSFNAGLEDGSDDD